MNIMHNKTVKFIAQLRRTTQHKQEKYTNIS